MTEEVGEPINLNPFLHLNHSMASESFEIASSPSKQWPPPENNLGK